MRYLKRFESKEYKEPIDVDADIEEFWEKFGDHIKKRDEEAEERWKREPDIRKRTDKLNQDFGHTMTDNWNYYEVCEVDDYGRCTYTLMTVRATNKDHAKLKCANKYYGKKPKTMAKLVGSLEIFTTGFYSAKKVDLDKEILDTESQIKSLQKKLDELNNIP